MRVRFLKEARDELKEAIRYYNRQRKGLGSELTDEVRSGVDLIRRYPLAWHSLSERFRRFPTNRFPYGLIYFVLKNEIVIVAVAHLHREPEYWSERF